MAVAITLADFGEEIGLETDAAADSASARVAARLHAVASAIVLKYAPAAPEAVSDEAVVRLGGYLWGSSSADYGAMHKQDVHGIGVEYAVNHGLAFRNSGAASLLAPWKVRHAGKCAP